MSDDLNEFVLNAQQRRKRGLIMKRFQVKLKVARERMKKRIADPDRLKAKARKMAIKMVRIKVAGKDKAANYENLSPSEKMMIDTKVQARQKLIDRLVLKLIPIVTRAEHAKFKPHLQPQHEEILDENLYNMISESYESLTELAKKPEVLNKFRDSAQNTNKIDTRNTDWMSGLVAGMKKNGFNLLGSGKYGVVFGKPDYQYVIKIFMKDSAYLRWVKFALDNPNNPFVPKIRGKVVKITPVFYGIRLEKLKPAIVWGTSEFFKEYSKWDNNNSYKSSNPDIQAVLDHFAENKKLIDLHSENVMNRDGQIVIIDPYYNFFNKHKSMDYTIDPDDIDPSVF